MYRLITREEVKKHNTNRSVWLIIHNQVYDVTKFLDEHPGGADSLMDYAGEDGSQAFEDVGHSDDAREMMKQYKIGKIPPEEHLKPPVASCCKPRKKSSGNASQIGTKDCLVCHQASSCPGLPKSTSNKERTWRTFDGSPDRPKTPKTEYKSPTGPRAEPRVQTIVVPRERSRRPRGPPCGGSSKLKWAILALGAAIIIGVVMKKYMT